MKLYIKLYMCVQAIYFRLFFRFVFLVAAAIYANVRQCDVIDTKKKGCAFRTGEDYMRTYVDIYTE